MKTLYVAVVLGLVLQGVMSDFKDECLKAHNEKRAKHNAPLLVWDDTLAAFADKVAHGPKFEHSDGNEYGENLAIAMPTQTCQDAVDNWYSEIDNYLSNSGGTGHFTQVVWKSSVKLGCAVGDENGADSGAGWKGQMLACEYDPRGNMGGEFENNVSV